LEEGNRGAKRGQPQTVVAVVDPAREGLHSFVVGFVVHTIASQYITGILSSSTTTYTPIIQDCYRRVTATPLLLTCDIPTCEQMRVLPILLFRWLSL